MGIESKILDQIEESLRQVLGETFRIEWKRPSSGETGEYDADITLRLDSQEAYYGGDIRKMIRRGDAFHLSSILHSRSREQEVRRMVLADYITDDAGEVLREEGIAYADKAGNCYIRNEGICIYVSGRSRQRSANESKKKLSGRAFRPSGLKLLFVLLSDPQRVKDTYRSLARTVNISRGTVSYVMNDLKRGGFVKEKQKGRELRKTDELFDRWVENFSETLRPRLVRTRCRFLDRERRQQWRQIQLNPETTCWGGEAAAELWTGHLKPKVLSVYTREPNSNLMKQLQVVPDPEGDVEVVEMFWESAEFDPVERIQENTPVVPPVLAYADLTASGETRNVEIAKRIYEDHIRGRI